MAGHPDPGARRLHHPLHRPVDRPHPGVHHAAGEQPDVAARAPHRRLPHRHTGRQAEPAGGGPGHQPRPLDHAERLRPGQQQPVVLERPQGEPLPSRDELRLLAGHGLPGGFHQVAEGHARRAGGLAAPAHHAGLDAVDEGVVGRHVVPLDLTHGGDAAPRRQRLVAAHPVGRTVGQAQPARHAAGQLVVVEAEVEVEPHGATPFFGPNIREGGSGGGLTGGRSGPGRAGRSGRRWT